MLCIWFALLGFAVPFLSKLLLTWRRRAYEKWFDGSASEVLSFRLKNGRAPSSKAPGHEGALGVWAEGLQRMAVDRSISRSQAASAFDALGNNPFLDTFELDTLPSDKRLREEFSVPLEPRMFGPCVALMTLCGFACSLAHMSLVATALYAVIAFFSAALALCDLRSRTIPFVLPLSLAAIGAAFQWVSFGLQGLADAALLALAFGGALLLTAFIGSALRKSQVVGMGDVLTMPAVVLCAGVPGAAYGLVLGCLLGAVALFARKMITGAHVRGLVPFGPVLAACSIAGPLITVMVTSSPL